MNKKLKVGVAGLALVAGASMLVGCKKDLSLDKYLEMMSEAGNNHYATYVDDEKYADLSTTASGSSVREWLSEVTYKATADATETTTEWKKFTSESNSSQTVEIDWVGNDAKDMGIRVTDTSVSVSSRYRANESTQLLEAYTTKTESTKVVTYVKTADGYKQYTSVTSKEYENDTQKGETSTTNTVYTYATEELYDAAIASVLEEVDSDLIEGFYVYNSMEYADLNPTFYKDGKAFGMEVSMVSADPQTEGDTTYISVGRMDLAFEFKDGKASSLTAKSTSEGEYKTEGEEKLTISYGSVSIEAPAGEYTTSVVPTSVSLKGVGF